MDNQIKSLFNKYEAYTEDGNKLSREAFQALEIIFVKYLELGYSTREIGHIIGTAPGILESEFVMDRAMKKRKAERNEI